MRSQQEQGKEAIPDPELPDEIWFLIAGIVGQKDWARVSGTCKAFRRTQLRVIETTSNRLDELSLAQQAREDSPSPGHPALQPERQQ